MDFQDAQGQLPGVALALAIAPHLKPVCFAVSVIKRGLAGLYAFQQTLSILAVVGLHRVF
jgi:hypothetical protein